MRIRPAKAKDIPAIAELSARLGELERTWEPLQKDPRKMKKQYIQYFTKRFRQKKVKIFVAEDKEVIGFVMGRIERLPDVYKYKQKGYVLDIYVMKKYRKKGVGTVLLDEMFGWFKQKKLKWIEITSDVKNKNAIAFYEHYGFKVRTLNLRKMQ